MKNVKICIMIWLVSCLCTISCKEKKQALTPWGEPVESSEVTPSQAFSLDDILSNGELIMLTLTGPDTYYDYHGRGLGLQYLLCENFAQRLGVMLRVEVCKDTAELYSRLEQGEGDIIAVPLPQKQGDYTYCGVRDTTNHNSWVVAKSNESLADTLDRWFHADLIAQTEKQQTLMLTTQRVTRHVYSPVLNRGKGIISQYDAMFKRYASVPRWDWRLLAAQCYQESTFDPKAHSWAGACGLMQIMPSTADQLGLARADIYDPEKNISAACRYLSQLNNTFSDVQNPTERIKFVLASYNGGARHVRDAMALAQKNQQNRYSWSVVKEYVLKLSRKEFYTDPVVKAGYMRGSETADYVDKIIDRWNSYRGVASPVQPSSVGGAASGSGVKKERKAKYQL